jgi:sigma-B regulation protein RsbU (phosphoserine phosphatase)
LPSSPETETGSGAASAAEGRWNRLFTLAADEARDGELLGALLEQWCTAAGARGAALYLADDGVQLSREQAAGSGSFPQRLSAAEAPAGYGLLALSSGTLLFSPAEAEAEAAAEVPLPALLALAARVRQLKRQLKREHFQASYRGVEQQALYDVGLAITSTLNLDDLSEAILSWAMSLLDARCAALYLLEGDEYALARVLGNRACPRFASSLVHQPPEDLLPGTRHLLTVRIEIEGQPRGLLVVADKESRHGVGPFRDADRRTLELFANQAAIALENARLHRQALEKERLEREMELAADIQRQILPDGVPDVPGFELVGWNRPARHVGGDYYDLLPMGEERVILTLGDVSGKGMPAALMVSILHSALRLMLDRLEFGAGLLERLNRHVLESSAPNKFITLLVAELDRGTGRLRYLNAGHNPAVVITAGGACRQLPSSGLPVGLMANATYHLGELDLAPGDLLCIYSDGITECADPDGEELGLERLVELLVEHHDQPLAQILAAIDETTTAFAQGQPQGDDQTVVLLRREA